VKEMILIIQRSPEPVSPPEERAALSFWQLWAPQQPVSDRAIQVISSPANPSTHCLVAMASQQKYNPTSSRTTRIRRQPFSILFMTLFYTFF
jgi:hypothetical protein